METKEELYSHADTHMVVTGCIVLDTLDMEVKVYPYSSEYDTKVVPLFNAATYYDHPDGNIYILRENQALVMLDEDISLMCPFQTGGN